MKYNDFEKRITVCPACLSATKLIVELFVGDGVKQVCSLLYEKGGSSEVFLKKGLSRMNDAFQTDALKFNNAAPETMYLTSADGVIFTSTSFSVRESNKVDSIIYQLICSKNPEHFMILSNRIYKYKSSHDIKLSLESLSNFGHSIMNNYLNGTEYTTIKSPTNWTEISLMPIDSWPTSERKFLARINSIFLLK